MKKLLIALSVMAAAVVVWAANDTSITTAYPQINDSSLTLQKRQAYAFASWVDGIWATNREITCNTMDVTNAVTARSTVAVTGAATFSAAMKYPKASVTCVNGAGNSNLTCNAARIYKVTGPTGHFTIAGLKAGTDGQLVTIYNLTAYNMTFMNNDSTTESNALSRITTLTGADVATTGAGAATLVYDSTVANWILLCADL